MSAIFNDTLLSNLYKSQPINLSSHYYNIYIFYFLKNTKFKKYIEKGKTVTSVLSAIIQFLNGETQIINFTLKAVIIQGEFISNVFAWMTDLNSERQLTK